MSPYFDIEQLIRRYLFRIILIMTSLAEADRVPSSPPNTNQYTIHKSASIGGSKVLECDILYPTSASTSTGEHSDTIMTWRKHGNEVPIFIQFNGYPPHIDEGFQGRIRLVEEASIEINDIRLEDEGWYECSNVLLDSTEDSNSINGTWIYLSVNAPPVLGEVSPSFLIQKEGEMVDIFCEAAGTPEPVISWQKDGREVMPTDRISVRENRIQVRNLVHSDGGVYVCSFSNIVGQISHTIKLVIEGADWNLSGNAYIMVRPQNMTAVEGTRVKLTCQAEGYPNNITYRWYHDGDDVQRSPGLMTRAGIYADGSFVINSIVKEDTGWYKCRPSNGLGPPPEAIAFLNVTYLPRVLARSSKIYLPRGMLGKIECPVDANPPVTLILWSKNEKMIDTTQMTRMRVTKQGALIIKSVIQTDEGRYACTPYSPLGAGKNSMPVQVYVKDPPYFSVRPELIYQRQLMETITLPCVAEGDPPPRISWKKSNGAFPPNTKTLLDGGNLTIVDLDKSDHGTYECIATNNVTSVIATSLLIIEPTTPHAPVNLTVECDEYSATLSWLPAFDGGLPQHYILWYQKQQKPVVSGWETLRVLPDDATSVTVYKLSPDTVYHFMVLSRNHLGDGLFSKTVATTTKEIVTPSSRKPAKPQPATSATPNKNSSENDRVNSTGPTLLPPVNIAIYQLRNGLNITWQPPKAGRISTMFYRIEYRTVGQWVPLADRISGNATSFLWTTASRGANYNFRIFSYNNRIESNSSQVVSMNTEDMPPFSGSLTSSTVGGIIGLLIFLFVTVIISVFAFKYFIKWKQREKVARYGNIKYFGPQQAEGNHRNHNNSDNSNSNNRVLKEQTCDIMESELGPVLDDEIITSVGSLVEKTMKETPI